METILVQNDHQIPYHDPRAVRAVTAVMHDVHPDVVVYLGDVFDMPGFSTKFRRFPGQKQRLIKDLKLGREMFAAHREAAPGARFVYVEGNHEARLRNYIVDVADELAGFVDEEGALSLPRLLGAADFGVEYLGPYGAAWQHNSFLFKHGDRATQYTAAAELRFEGTSGMSGHTHRGGVSYNTNRSGAHAWWENFCLCHVTGWKRPPSSLYTSGPSNWQQGFSVIDFEGKLFHVDPVTVHEGKCIFRGRRYG